MRSDVRDEEAYKGVKEQSGTSASDLFDDFRADFKKKLRHARALLHTRGNTRAHRRARARA